MPLSEEELRMLEQMERALVEEDPKLASTLRGTTMRRAARRRAIGAGVVFLGGVAVMLGGAVSGYTVIGVVGFVIMLASATLGIAAVRSRQQVGVEGQGETPSAATDGPFTVIEGGRRGGRGRNRERRSRDRASGSFMERMEERWRRRREGGQGF